MIRLLAGDCRDVLAALAADSIHCVVTSPPYYGLRDYGCAGQIGLEATPEEYLATMVGVFREVRRVLRRDGTCWVNMGDSYVSNVGVGGPQSWARTPAADGVKRNDRSFSMRSDLYRGAAKPKDLLLMPARLAIALQQDGWWVRSDIIWHKPNPMPESCRDRPTSAHEHVFLLTKSARYFYDNDAISEPALRAGDVPGGTGGFISHMTGGHNKDGLAANGQKPVAALRNLRNVWTIATAPYSEAHFATFPPALAERCIKAGTSERGCCSQCGKPWVSIIERSDTGRTQKMADGWDTGDGGHGTVHRNGRESGEAGKPIMASVTTGWRAGCDHDADVVPCTVLDPFAGAGTTLLVADRLQRDAIGVELNTQYTELAMARCRADAPLFVDVPAADPEDERMADLFAEAAE